MPAWQEVVGLFPDLENGLISRSLPALQGCWEGTGEGTVVRDCLPREQTLAGDSGPFVRSHGPICAFPRAWAYSEGSSLGGVWGEAQGSAQLQPRSLSHGTDRHFSLSLSLHLQEMGVTPTSADRGRWWWEGARLVSGREAPGGG